MSLNLIFPSFDLVRVYVMHWTCMTKIYDFYYPLGEGGPFGMSQEIPEWNKSLMLKSCHAALTTWGLNLSCRENGYLSNCFVRIRSLRDSGGGHDVKVTGIETRRVDWMSWPADGIRLSWTADLRPFWNIWDLGFPSLDLCPYWASWFWT